MKKITIQKVPRDISKHDWRKDWHFYNYYMRCQSTFIRESRIETSLSQCFTLNELISHDDFLNLPFCSPVFMVSTVNNTEVNNVPSITWLFERALFHFFRQYVKHLVQRQNIQLPDICLRKVVFDSSQFTARLSDVMIFRKMHVLDNMKKLSISHVQYSYFILEKCVKTTHV